MSVSSAGSSSNAYAYLQSLLQQGSTKNSDASGSADPLTELLAAFYPAGASDQAGSGSSAGSTSTTAGASAPEDVVQECIEYLQKRFDATIQEEWVREENVHFPLPKSLRDLLPAAAAVEANGD